MINVSPDEYSQLMQKPFCTADDLEKAMDYHRCVLDAWLNQHNQQVVPTRPTLQKLINLIYHVSLIPEEGRFLRFTICVLSHQPKQSMMLMTFQPIPLQDVEDLRKLAPIAAQHSSALRIEENERGLCCVGLMTLEEMVVAPSPIGLVIRVNGPGDIWCAEFEYFLTLRRGRIRDLRAAHRVPVVRDWFRNLGEQMADRWLTSKGQVPGPWVDSSFRDMAVDTAAQLFAFFWSSMLDAAVDLQHGGMFVVLDSVEAAPMKTKYHLSSTTPLQELNDYYGVEMDSHASGRRADAQLMARWQRLMPLFSALAHLSVVDNCVVFDRSMTPRSFGSEIRVNENEVSKVGKTLVEGGLTETQIPESQVMNYGTRHRSAIRLCQAVEGALAFVISQDGDLRVFHSDKSHVHRWDNLNVLSKW